MSYEAMARQPIAVWGMVEDELVDGWSGKFQDACRMAGVEPLVLVMKSAKLANELGAPVQQLFTACAIRYGSHGRPEYS